MKKLLALLLCVMMFVAIIPTNAFAWEDKAVSNTAIKEAEKSIKNMYTAIATDELVFGTAKSLYDLSNGLAENMFDGIESVDKFGTTDKKTYHDDLVANTRKYMNAIIGDSIADYISKRVDTFKSSTINGGVDPEKYLKVYVDALNEALTSEKAQKAIEAFAYNLTVLKTMSAVKDEAEDIQTAIKDWGSSKWDEFGDKFDHRTKVYNTDPVVDKDNKGWVVVKGGMRDPMTNPWAYTTDAFGTAIDENNFDVASIWSMLTSVEDN